MEITLTLTCFISNLSILFVLTDANYEHNGDRTERKPDASTECILNRENSEEAFIIDTVFQNYEKQALPSREGVDVSVEMTINDISSLSELDSEFVLDIFFSEIWRDGGLNYSSIPGVCLKNVTLDLEYLDRIWQPNTCIVNSKSAEIHSSPSDNVFLILYDDGRIWKNCRMRVKAPCDIELKNFPFDRQRCNLVFESYSYNSQKVRLKWFEEAPVSFVKKIKLPDFTLSKHKIEHIQIMYPNGMWDELKVTFYFERRYGFFVLQAYVPTYMTIFVAWINFWMDPRELSTRATLSISAFLAMTLQFGNILKNQPRVSYIKAIDVWMLGGISFLFFALAELAVISYMQRTDRRSKTKPRQFAIIDGISVMQPITKFTRRKRGCCQNLKFGGRRGKDKKNLPVTGRKSTCSRLISAISEKCTPYYIDRFSLITFPPLFILFNISYWCYYITASKNSSQQI